MDQELASLRAIALDGDSVSSLELKSCSAQLSTRSDVSRLYSLLATITGNCLRSCYVLYAP